MSKSSGRCGECGGKIHVMAFRNTGVCCELCRKSRDGEITRKEVRRLRKNHSMVATRDTTSSAKLGPTTRQHRE